MKLFSTALTAAALAIAQPACAQDQTWTVVGEPGNSEQTTVLCLTKDIDVWHRGNPVMDVCAERLIADTANRTIWRDPHFYYGASQSELFRSVPDRGYTFDQSKVLAVMERSGFLAKLEEERAERTKDEETMQRARAGEGTELEKKVALTRPTCSTVSFSNVAAPGADKPVTSGLAYVIAWSETKYRVAPIGGQRDEFLVLNRSDAVCIDHKPPYLNASKNLFAYYAAREVIIWR